MGTHIVINNLLHNRKSKTVQKYLLESILITHPPSANATEKLISLGYYFTIYKTNCATYRNSTNSITFNY